MSKRMLIDASHPEETRVVVLDGNKVEEFDFEAASRRPLKGNIYLAKVTRVEPSLQAAFVEYGGNRQGFLAFSEVHPDYYQIPVADRLALIADQSRRLIEEEEEIDAVATNLAPSKPGISTSNTAAEDGEDDENSDSQTDAVAFEDVNEDEREDADDVETSEPGSSASAQSFDDQESDRGSDDAPDGVQDFSPEGTPSENNDEVRSEQDDDLDAPQTIALDADEDDTQNDGANTREPDSEQPGETESEETTANGQKENTEVLAESIGAAPAMERKSRRARPPRRRHYKIQEVMRRKQIILVQVVKEERGNKGASLTTYLSLAGRYCVLMPNTPRGGGISRKITSVTDRKRLKSAAQSLELPEGMGLIIRTAGANRTKAEIKRDYEYLLRLWDSVRELTLQSNAPALVYEEGNLVKRTIRDLYGKEISEVLVDGEAGYREAKDFMRMIMPSHAKNVKLYKDEVSLFQRHQVEAQLDAMFSPVVTLKSGGYLVINQTEALVAIDVNSGKATREHSIEETARKTNLEAADEIGRQLRLRDLAGLIVVDFIDMEDGKNDRSVEKRLRDALRTDRARIQVGKISQFGLLEMSRQRLRAGVLAGSTVLCPHCDGLGYIRSTESASLQLLRALDDEGQQQAAVSLIARAPDKIIIYTLNHKRSEISRIEKTYEMSIAFQPKDDMSGGTFEIERVGKRAASAQRKPPVVSIETGFQNQEDDEDDEQEDDIVEDIAAEAEESESEGQAPREEAQTEDGNGRKRRRRRRRGGRGRGQNSAEASPVASAETTVQTADAETAAPGESEVGHRAEATESEEITEPKRRRRRRGRRGRKPAQDVGASTASAATDDANTPATDDDKAAPDQASTEHSHHPIAAQNGAQGAQAEPQHGSTSSTVERLGTRSSAPPERTALRPPAASNDATVPEDLTIASSGAESAPATGATRKGWWQRKLGI